MNAYVQSFAFNNAHMVEWDAVCVLPNVGNDMNYGLGKMRMKTNDEGSEESRERYNP